MRYSLFTEPQQGSTYDEQLALARLAERLGFYGFFRSDHFLKMGDITGLPGPTDSWVSLGGLARETSTIRLGTLLSSATFRYPGHLSIIVSQVDHMSNGRIELGLGAGWYEDEHRAYGIPFPDQGDRFERLEEQLAIITGIWKTPSGDTYSFSGKHYQLEECPALPRPIQTPHPRLIVGGLGTKRTPRMAARYADEYNLPFASLDTFKSQQPLAATACEQIGREPQSLERSIALVACCGSTESEFARRAKAIGREPSELRINGIAGLVDEAVEKLNLFREAGATSIYLQVLDTTDTEHIELIANEILPHAT